MQRSVGLSVISGSGMVALVVTRTEGGFHRGKEKEPIVLSPDEAVLLARTLMKEADNAKNT